MPVSNDMTSWVRVHCKDCGKHLGDLPLPLAERGDSLNHDCPVRALRQRVERLEAQFVESVEWQVVRDISHTLEIHIFPTEGQANAFADLNPVPECQEGGIWHPKRPPVRKVVRRRSA